MFQEKAYNPGSIPGGCIVTGRYMNFSLDLRIFAIKKVLWY